jgi:hypothetical protein
MHRRRRRAVLLLLLVLAAAFSAAAFAPAPLPRRERSQTDQTDVGGLWEIVLWEYQQVRYQQGEQAYRAEVKRERFALTNSSAWDMQLYPKTSPPSFVWKMGGRVLHVGSYRLRGDELTIVFVHSERLDARPTDFSTSPPNGWRFVMRHIRRD